MITQSRAQQLEMIFEILDLISLSSLADLLELKDLAMKQSQVFYDRMRAKEQRRKKRAGKKKR